MTGRMLISCINQSFQVQRYHPYDTYLHPFANRNADSMAKIQEEKTGDSWLETSFLYQMHGDIQKSNWALLILIQTTQLLDGRVSIFTVCSKTLPGWLLHTKIKCWLIYSISSRQVIKEYNVGIHYYNKIGTWVNGVEMMASRNLFCKVIMHEKRKDFLNSKFNI